MWSSCPWVSTIATTSSIRSRMEVKSGRMTSMPGWCSSGNSTPQSTTSSLPACSKTVMLRPISPRPPRAITRRPPSGRAGGVRSSGWLRLMAGTLRRGPDSGTGATAPGAVTPVRECRRPLRSDRADVLRLGALLALRDVELDLLSLVEGLVAVGDDGGVVAEDVGAAAVLGDEPEALLRVEPLHSALSHAVSHSVLGGVRAGRCRPSGRRTTGRTERNVRQRRLRTFKNEAEAQQRPGGTIRCAGVLWCGTPRTGRSRAVARPAVSCHSAPEGSVRDLLHGVPGGHM